MTLTARSQDLSEALDSFGALKCAAENLRELRHRHERLQSELDRLRPAMSLLAAARARVPDLPFVPAGELVKALGMLAALSVEFAKDPQAVVASEFGTTLQAVKRGVNAVEAHARMLWASQAVPVRDEIKGELLEALARIPAWRADVERIQTLQADLAHIAVMPIVSSAQFEEFFRLADQRNSAWQGLQGDGGIPASVIEFLRACAKDGIPLDTLSPEVTAWLRERNILQYFRVRL